MTKFKIKTLLPWLTVVLAGGAYAQGDSCSTAIPLTGTGTFAYDTSGMTESLFNGGGSCGASALAMNIDGFWQWTAPASGNYIFDTFGTAYDTRLSIHGGVACAATCIDFDDNTSGLQSQVSLVGLAAGDMILIQVGGDRLSNVGPGTLNITSFAAPPPPPNNNCSTAMTITGPGAFPFDTTAASTSHFDGGGSCPAGSTTINQDVFMQWTVPAAGDWTFDTAGSFFDTKLSVHSGVGCTATCIGFNDDTSGFTSEVQLPGLVAGESILIQVGGFGSFFGLGTLNINPWVDPCTTVPDDGFEDNDACMTPSGISPGIHAGLFVSGPDPDFYSIPVPAGDVLSVDVLSFSYGLDFNVFDANCNLLSSELHSWSYTNASAVQETIVFEALADLSDPQACTSYALLISHSPDPCASIPDDIFEDNDACLTPSLITSGVHNGLFTSTTDLDFYSVAVPAGNILDVDLVAFSSDVDFNVYDNNCNLLSMEFDDWAYTNTSSLGQLIIFEVFPNPTNPQSCANYDLVISVTPDICIAALDDYLEENDNCASATVMSDGVFPDLFVSKTDKDLYAFCVPDGGTVNLDVGFFHANGDVDVFLREAASPECGNGSGPDILAEGGSASDDEHISWTNITGSDLSVVFEVSMWPGSPTDCNNYDMFISGSSDCVGLGGAGTSFCDPASNNSTGFPAVLTGDWHTGIGSDLHLEVVGGVPGGLVYLLVGNEATPALPISNGTFCLAGTPTAQFFRFNVAGTDMNSIGGFDATGRMINAVGTSTTGFGFDVPSTIPSAVPITIRAGDTWHFQAWFRDTPAAVGASNFTNGLSVNF